MRGARRLVRGSNQRWEITVAPDGRDDVAVTLPGERACGAVGAVCTADGRRLSNSPSATVPGPLPVPLTAAFHDLPFEHDGETPFTFELRFSEDVEGLSCKTLRDDAFTVTNGGVRGARRLVRGSNERWEITVAPSAAGVIEIQLPPAYDCAAAGAVCTADGRPLASGLLAQVLGPAALTVADARVEEGAGAVLAFEVQLSRPATRTVTVDYATADGSAQARADYTAAGGTLTFQPGETGKTVEVAVLDDAHDEGEETFTLALSNASGARLEDAEATGTIKNTDLMPAALLARFGRATAEQVVEHVAERMAAPRERGFRARFAGREFRPGMERDFALGFLSQFGQPMGASRMGASPAGAAPMGANPVGAASMSAASMGASPMGARLSGHGAGAAGAVGMTGQHLPMGGATATAGYGPLSSLHGGGLPGSFLPGGDLFSNSEFELNREQHGGVVSIWSRSSRSHFGGMDGALSLNGDVRTTMLGADYRRGPLTVGLSVGRTLGLGGYGGPSAGQVTSSMTGFYPWLGYQLNDRVSVWGVTGYGTGALSLTPDGAAALDTGMSMAMTAAGTRGELIGSRATGGFALAFKADALWVGAGTEQVDGTAGRLTKRVAGRGDARADGAGGLAGLQRGRPGVADAERRGRAAAGRRRRRDRHGHGRRRRPRLLGLGDGAVAGRADADAVGAPGRGVHRAGHVAVVRLGPDAVEPAGAHRAGSPVVGRVGDGRRRCSLAQPDGVWDGVAPDGRLRRTAQRRGGLRAPRGPLRRNAERRGRDLSVRTRLPVRLSAGPAGARRAGLRPRGVGDAPGERHDPGAGPPSHDLIHSNLVTGIRRCCNL